MILIGETTTRKGMTMPRGAHKISDEEVALMRKMYFEFSARWTQARLAEHFGLSQAYVSEILAGKKRKHKGGADGR